MSVWRTEICVGQTPHVLTQFHIIPAFVMKDSFPLLEWKSLITVTTSHVEVRCLRSEKNVVVYKVNTVA